MRRKEAKRITEEAMEIWKGQLSHLSQLFIQKSIQPLCSRDERLKKEHQKKGAGWISRDLLFNLFNYLALDAWKIWKILMNVAPCEVKLSSLLVYSKSKVKNEMLLEKSVLKWPAWLREEVVKKKMAVKITIKIRHEFTFQGSLMVFYLLSCKTADWHNKKNNS